jgi:hypothetical protein
MGNRVDEVAQQVAISEALALQLPRRRSGATRFDGQNVPPGFFPRSE